MKRKAWLSLILVFTMVLAIVGCGSQPTAENGTKDAGGDSGGGSGDKVTLTLWYWNRSIDDKLLDEARKQFPNINLKAEKIGGDFKAKLNTTLAAGSGGPDIVGLNSWIAEFFPNADQFVNLFDYGADDLKSQFLEWKWNQAVTPDGKSMIALPMDTGPTALFYREDLFAQAGLPTDPAEVSDKLKTWDDYIEAAKKFKGSKTFMFDSPSTVFTQALAQSDKAYFDKNNNFIGDQDQVKNAWDLAVKVHQEGLDAGIDGWTPEWNAAMNNGTVASFIGAVWMKNVLKDAAPDTKGKWRIARAPGGDGNNGGSFIAITKQSKHPKEAYELIKWLFTPEHQLNSLVTMDLFPSTPSIYNDPKMTPAEDFFGDQKTNEIFMKSAENVKDVYFGPKYSLADKAFKDELALVAKQNMDSQKAWQEAVDKIKKDLSR